MSEAVDPGQGYRLLKEGEEIRRGDEVWAFGDGPWVAVSKRLAGRKFEDAEHHPVRRLDPAPEAAPAEGVDGDTSFALELLDSLVKETVSGDGEEQQTYLDALAVIRAALSRSEAALARARSEASHG